MTQPRIKSEDLATVRLVNAFSDALSVQRRACLAVENTSANLPWQGIAATEYRNALAEWNAGLTRVSRALESLQGTMQKFAASTTTTEDDNKLLAAQAIGAIGGRASWT